MMKQHKNKPVPQLRDKVLSLLDDRKAQDIVILDLQGKSSIADYMVIATGTSQRHIVAMAELLAREMAPETGYLRMEGLPHGDWVLIDSGEVIVHLFRSEVRAFYELEKLWE